MSDEKIDFDLKKIEDEAKAREELNNRKTQDLIQAEVERRIKEAEDKKAKEAEAKAKEDELERIKKEKEDLEKKYKEEEEKRQEEIKELKSKMGGSKGANQSPFDNIKSKDDFDVDKLTQEQINAIEDKSEELWLESQGLSKSNWNKSLGK